MREEAEKAPVAATPCVHLRRRRQGPLQRLPRPLREPRGRHRPARPCGSPGGLWATEAGHRLEPGGRAGRVGTRQATSHASSPPWEAFAGTGCQAPRESCPRATFRRSGAGKAKTCYRARHFDRAPGRTWEPLMRCSHHAGSSSATPTATPAQAGGDATSCKAGIPALQGREDVKAFHVWNTSAPAYTPEQWTVYGWQGSTWKVIGSSTLEFSSSTAPSEGSISITPGLYTGIEVAVNAGSSWVAANEVTFN